MQEHWAVMYFGIGVPADDNVNRAWCALAQDCVDIIQSHVVNHRVIDLDDLVPIAESIRKAFVEIQQTSLSSFCINS